VRILHVIRSANPAGGGPIEAVSRLGAEHQRAGRHVEIVTLDAPGTPCLDGLPIPAHALGPVTTKYGYTSRLVPWLREHAASYDVVVVNGIWQYPSLAVWRACRRRDVPYVVFPHGMLDPWFKQRYPLKHAKKWLYWPWAEYRVLRDAAAVLFTSQDEMRLATQSFWLHRWTPKVITYGTAPPPEGTEPQRAAFLGRFPQLADSRIVLFLGRLHEKKGCELLVNAFASLVSSVPGDRRPWHLVFAGPGEDSAYAQRLQALAAEGGVGDRVTFTGMLTGDAKWGAFRAAEVFALPSHQENFGVAMAEALACGVPVLLSDKVNTWREVTAAGAGFVAADDLEGTRRTLHDWMQLDEPRRDGMRDAARRCFARHFHISAVAEDIARTLEGLS
jgi:glycosyltransferase involved in cell wall biosynthesis